MPISHFWSSQGADGVVEEGDVRGLSEQKTSWGFTNSSNPQCTDLIQDGWRDWCDNSPTSPPVDSTGPRSVWAATLRNESKSSHECKCSTLNYTCTLNKCVRCASASWDTPPPPRNPHYCYRDCHNFAVFLIVTNVPELFSVHFVWGPQLNFVQLWIPDICWANVRAWLWGSPMLLGV